MRLAAISTGPDTHLDHLGVLALLLEIPLIVTDRKSYELAHIFYPQARTQFVEPQDLSLEFLVKHFDLLFSCGKYWYMELSPIMKLLFQKNMRFVLCPHGNSDKGSTLSDALHPPQDIALIYGEHMRNLLQQNGALSRVGTSVVTGNWRYPFYRRHREFYDALAEEKIFSRFDKQKLTILYAPTWSSKENPTAFYEATLELIQQLKDDYNLLIKPHPLLEEDQPGYLADLQSKCADLPHVACVMEFPAIYPILSRADIYIGDFSSIGYDFLAFDKPLYFFNLKKTSHPPLLYQCGIEIPLVLSTQVKKFLTTTLEQNRNLIQRQKIYDYAFGREREISEIKKEVLTLLDTKQG